MNIISPIIKSIYGVVARIGIFISFIAIFLILYEYGFTTSSYQPTIERISYLIVLIGILTTLSRYIQKKAVKKSVVVLIDILSMLFSTWVIFQYVFVGKAFEADLLLKNNIWVKIALFFTIIRELSEIRINYKRTLLHPAQLFVISFFLIIMLGTFLLLLPRATNGYFSFIDALFTATSAVCVTGLAVVDTGSFFTQFGQFILLFLIQIGGLGILTFASYFSYFFKGGTSYENQLALSDITSSKKIGDVFSTLKYIILITFLVELSSAVFIYLSLPKNEFSSNFDRVFFSAFHSISAFCNAGFSTLSSSLYQNSYQFNYSLQLIIILTFVLGGLGFPIVSNIYSFISYKLRNLLNFEDNRLKYRPWIVNLNSRITLITTLSISALAFLLFYVLEFNNTLQPHSGIGKIVTAMFGATTPRTAGFNTIDTSQVLMPSLLMIILLMWIGASPSSTGGGIKTSTIAIAVLNVFSIAKGKNRIEVYRREISEMSVRRAFATISLSLLVIGLGITFVSAFDPNESTKNIIFECFSAFSTVGLSIGTTANYSDASKIVLILLMFIGRVSTLTIIIALFKKVKHKNYRYPTEEITIN
jgi:Trk-type K+ transport system membrane component